MKLNRMLGVLVLLITITTFIAFAQEPEVSAPATSTMPADLAPAPMQNENNTQWVWGEVTNLDNQAKTLTLKYLDYETDQEKELVLTIDEKTTYENIKSFDEIKVKDTLSVDYATGPEDKNIVKNISLEKPDALPPVPAQPDTNALQPGGSPEMSTPVSVQPETTAGSPTAVIQAPAPAVEKQGQ
jgi:biopolymer transport protein ExbD